MALFVTGLEQIQGYCEGEENASASMHFYKGEGRHENKLLLSVSGPEYSGSIFLHLTKAQTEDMIYKLLETWERIEERG